MNAHFTPTGAVVDDPALDAPAARPTVDTPRDIIRRLAQNFSLEIAPVAAAKIAFFNEVLPEKSPVFVPVLPGTALADNVALVARLAQDGMRPVPHIAARRLSSYGELDDALSRFRETGGIEDVLVIAGDPAKAAGPFRSSLDVLESGLLERHDISRVFVAGHPEPNPDIPVATARDFLMEKNVWARETGTVVEVVTQFSFSSKAILSWEREMRAAGNELPIRVGLAGPTKPATLLKFAAMCGVKASAGFAAKAGLKLTKMTSERAPDDVISGLVAAMLSDTDSRIAGLHLFTFGGFAKAARWITAVADDRFTPNAKLTGFSVEG